MQEDTSFRGDVIGLCISIKGRNTEGKGRHQQGLSLLKPYYYSRSRFLSSRNVPPQVLYDENTKTAA